MSRLLKTGLAVAATLSMASTAMAVKITPEGPSTASGNATLKKSGVTLTCTTTLKGTVTGGVAKVTSATFAGTNSFCKSVTAQSLPWTIKADTLTTGHGDGIAVNTPIGNCSATNNVPGTFNNSTHALTFNNATLTGGCSITGTLTTSNNALTITN